MRSDDTVERILRLVQAAAPDLPRVKLESIARGIQADLSRLHHPYIPWNIRAHKSHEHGAVGTLKPT
jgi:hypothetical protein